MIYRKCCLVCDIDVQQKESSTISPYLIIKFDKIFYEDIDVEVVLIEDCTRKHIPCGLTGTTKLKLKKGISMLYFGDLKLNLFFAIKRWLASQSLTPFLFRLKFMWLNDYFITERFIIKPDYTDHKLQKVYDSIKNVQPNSLFR